MSHYRVVPGRFNGSRSTGPVTELPADAKPVRADAVTELPADAKPVRAGTAAAMPPVDDDFKPAPDGVAQESSGGSPSNLRAPSLRARLADAIGRDRPLDAIVSEVEAAAWSGGLWVSDRSRAHPAATTKAGAGVRPADAVTKAVAMLRPHRAALRAAVQAPARALAEAELAATEQKDLRGPQRALREAFRSSLREGDRLAEVLAAVQAAAHAVLGLNHYPFQLSALEALLLEDVAAELETGAGKSLLMASTLVVHAQSGLPGVGLCPTDALSLAHIQKYGPLYHALGVDVAVLVDADRYPHRHEGLGEDDAPHGGFVFDPDYVSEDPNMMYLRPVSRTEAYRRSVVIAKPEELGYDLSHRRSALPRHDLGMASERLRSAMFFFDEFDQFAIDRAFQQMNLSGPDPHAEDLRPAVLEVAQVAAAPRLEAFRAALDRAAAGDLKTAQAEWSEAAATIQPALVAKEWPDWKNPPSDAYLAEQVAKGGDPVHVWVRTDAQGERSAVLTELGQRYFEDRLGLRPGAIYGGAGTLGGARLSAPSHAYYGGLIESALAALYTHTRNRSYADGEGGPALIDRDTGTVSPAQRLSHGDHPALEAKLFLEQAPPYLAIWDFLRSAIDAGQLAASPEASAAWSAQAAPLRALGFERLAWELENNPEIWAYLCHPRVHGPEVDLDVARSLAEWNGETLVEVGAPTRPSDQRGYGELVNLPYRYVTATGTNASLEQIEAMTVGGPPRVTPKLLPGDRAFGLATGRYRAEAQTLSDGRTATVYFDALAPAGASPVSFDRIDYGRQVFGTNAEMFPALSEQVRMDHRAGKPSLLGFATDEELLEFGAYLKAQDLKVPFFMVPAGTAPAEVRRIKDRAGRAGAVVLANLQFGRGTDIELGGAIEGWVEELQRAHPDWTEERIERQAQRRQTESRMRALGQDTSEAAARADMGLQVYPVGFFERRKYRQLTGRGNRFDDPGAVRSWISLESFLARLDPTLKKRALAALAKESLSRSEVAALGPVGQLVRALREVSDRTSIDLFLAASPALAARVVSGRAAEGDGPAWLGRLQQILARHPEGARRWYALAAAAEGQPMPADLLPDAVLSAAEWGELHTLVLEGALDRLTAPEGEAPSAVAKLDATWRALVEDLGQMAAAASRRVDDVDAVEALVARLSSRREDAATEQQKRNAWQHRFGAERLGAERDAFLLGFERTNAHRPLAVKAEDDRLRSRLSVAEDTRGLDALWSALGVRAADEVSVEVQRTGDLRLVVGRPVTADAPASPAEQAAPQRAFDFEASGAQVQMKGSEGIRFLSPEAASALRRLGAEVVGTYVWGPGGSRRDAPAGRTQWLIPRTHTGVLSFSDLRAAPSSQSVSARAFAAIEAQLRPDAVQAAAETLVSARVRPESVSPAALDGARSLARFWKKYGGTPALEAWQRSGSTPVVTERAVRHVLARAEQDMALRLDKMSPAERADYEAKLRTYVRLANEEAWAELRLDLEHQAEDAVIRAQGHENADPQRAEVYEYLKGIDEAVRPAFERYRFEKMCGVWADLTPEALVAGADGGDGRAAPSVRRADVAARPEAADVLRPAEAGAEAQWPSPADRGHEAELQWAVMDLSRATSTSARGDHRLADKLAKLGENPALLAWLAAQWPSPVGDGAPSDPDGYRSAMPLKFAQAVARCAQRAGPQGEDMDPALKGELDAWLARLYGGRVLSPWALHQAARRLADAVSAGAPSAGQRSMGPAWAAPLEAAMPEPYRAALFPAASASSRADETRREEVRAHALWAMVAALGDEILTAAPQDLRSASSRASAEALLEAAVVAMAVRRAASGALEGVASGHSGLSALRARLLRFRNLAAADATAALARGEAIPAATEAWSEALEAWNRALDGPARPSDR